MNTARQRIVEQIASKQSESTRELSQALGTTPANIRHHLGILLEEGAIEIVDQRPSSGRGRPTYYYALTRQTQSHNLDRLADALLKELLDNLDPDDRLAALTRISKRLGDHSIAGSLAQRLNTCVHVLSEMHYEARWEARSSGPRLVLSHCPYAVILPKHPELCLMDASLLEGMLATSIVQVARLAHSRQGGKVCIFTIRIG